MMSKPIKRDSNIAQGRLNADAAALKQCVDVARALAAENPDATVEVVVYGQDTESRLAMNHHG